MKDLTLFPLINAKYKLLGLALAFISLSLLITEKITEIKFVNSLSLQQHMQFIFLVMIISLFLVAFTKEKLDDDRVKIVRNKSFQLAFGFILSIIIAFSLVSTIHPELSTSGQNDLNLIALIGLIFYLIAFNIGLYSDPNWIYNTGTLIENVEKHKIIFIIYVLLTFFGLLYLAF